MTAAVFDDFATALDAATWKNGYNIFNNASGIAANQLARVTVAASVLSLTAAVDGSTPNGYASGLISSLGSWTYGRVAVRAKMPAGVGMWPAIWMMPDTVNGRGTPPGSSTIPPDGTPEIDILELPQVLGGSAGRNTTTGHFTYHWTALDGTPYYKQCSVTIPDASTAYRIYEVEWTPTYIAWMVDGVLLARCGANPVGSWTTYRNPGSGYVSTADTAPIIYTGPMYLIANNQVGALNSWSGLPDGTTTFPNSVLIDWVSVTPYGPAPVGPAPVLMAVA